MELFPLLSRAIKSHFPSQVPSLLQITAVHITNKLCHYYLCLSGALEDSRGETIKIFSTVQTQILNVSSFSQIVEGAIAEAMAICDIKMFINLMSHRWNNRSRISLWSGQSTSHDKSDICEKHDFPCSFTFNGSQSLTVCKHKFVSKICIWMFSQIMIHQ